MCNLSFLLKIKEFYIDERKRNNNIMNIIQQVESENERKRYINNIFNIILRVKSREECKRKQSQNHDNAR